MSLLSVVVTSPFGTCRSSSPVLTIRSGVRGTGSTGPAEDAPDEAPVPVATVDPDRLIARCGEAVQDVTKEVFPIFIRTMSYPAGGNRTLVLAFSRTAEEKSDWVFLSMNEETGSSSYETPDAKIAALPCLDSTK